MLRSSFIAGTDSGLLSGTGWGAGANLAIRAGFVGAHVVQCDVNGVCSCLENFPNMSESSIPDGVDEEEQVRVHTDKFNWKLVGQFGQAPGTLLTNHHSSYFLWYPSP